MENLLNKHLPQSEYFLQIRSDVAELIPKTSKNILEIGCGYGALGRLLVKRQDCQIDGVEINPAAEEYLKETYRRYWIGNIELIDIGCGQQYDCILLPDVLEHLVSPWTTLQKLADILVPNGVVVASIPNIRNLGILYRLFIKGRWEYEPSGLLDRGHLRFFTRTEIQHLFADANLMVEICKENRDHYPGAKGVFSRLMRFFVPDIDICQYLVCARKHQNV